MPPIKEQMSAPSHSSPTFVAGIRGPSDQTQSQVPILEYITLVPQVHILVYPPGGVSDDLNRPRGVLAQSEEGPGPSAGPRGRALPVDVAQAVQTGGRYEYRHGETTPKERRFGRYRSHRPHHPRTEIPGFECRLLNTTRVFNAFVEQTTKLKSYFFSDSRFRTGSARHLFPMRGIRR